MSLTVLKRGTSKSLKTNNNERKKEKKKTTSDRAPGQAERRGAQLRCDGDTKKHTKYKEGRASRQECPLPLL